jgi:hypothetical protein
MLARIIIRGRWSDCVGTDYCEPLGIYEVDANGEPCQEAWDDACQVAWDRWSPQDPCDEWDEGPEYYIEIYDPEKHDRKRAGGGSFEPEFTYIEKLLDK